MNFSLKSYHQRFCNSIRTPVFHPKQHHYNQNQSCLGRCKRVANFDRITKSKGPEIIWILAVISIYTVVVMVDFRGRNCFVQADSNTQICQNDDPSKLITFYEKVEVCNYDTKPNLVYKFNHSPFKEDELELCLKG